MKIYKCGTVTVVILWKMSNLHTNVCTCVWMVVWPTTQRLAKQSIIIIVYCKHRCIYALMEYQSP